MLLPFLIQLSFVEMKCILFLLTVCIRNEIIYGLNQASTSTEEQEYSSYKDSDEGLYKELVNIESDAEYDEHSDAEYVEQSDAEYVEQSDAEYVDSKKLRFRPYDRYHGFKAYGLSKKKLAIYNKEIALGDPADLFATNKQKFQPHEYKDLGRRFVLQYPYSDAKQDDKLRPKKASPEVVLAVAKKSALLEASKKVNPSEHIMTDVNVLRNGDYWNGVWQENVNPKSQLRSKRLKKQKLTSVKAKIMPGSNLYELISKLKRISPRLLYVINKESKP